MAAEYPLKVVLSAVDQVTAPVRKINAQLAKINAPFVKLNNSIRALGQEAGFGRLSKSLGAVAHNAAGAAQSLAGLGLKVAAIGGLAAGGIFAWVKSVADVGDAAEKAAQRAGISVKAWTEYAYAASLADVSNEGLLNGFRKLNQNSVAAQLGSKQMAAWFKRAGVSIGNLKKLGPDALMEKIADQFAGMQDGAKKTALAMALFGKSGADLIPLLNSGSKGIRETREEAEKLGLSWKDQDAAAAAQFNDDLSRLRRTLQGLRDTIGISLLPVFDDMIVSAREWILANRELIQTKVIGWIKDFRAAWPGLKKNILDTLKAGKDLITGANDIIQSLGGWKTALLALGGVMAIDTVASIVKLMGTLSRLSVVLTTTPAGLLLLAGAGLAWLVTDISKHAQKGIGHGPKGEARDYSKPGAPLVPAIMNSPETPRPSPFNALNLTPPALIVKGAPGGAGAGGNLDIHITTNAPTTARVVAAGRGNIRTSVARTGRLMPDIGGGL